MAIPDTLAARLIEVVNAHNISGDFAMLGRQRWRGKRKLAAADLLDATLEKYYPNIIADDLANSNDEYAENFFKTLGFDNVDSIDVSDFEGATIVQDLGGELDPNLASKFDAIYDGGTCEHVFNLPQAYKNIDLMLKPGGVLIGHSPCNNWINHAFYQICPEMVYGFWENAMGYELLHLTLQPLLPAFALKTVKTTNPNETGKRPRLKGKPPQNSPLILNYAVRKPTAPGAGTKQVFQTDYQVKWSDKSDQQNK